MKIKFVCVFVFLRQVNELVHGQSVYNNNPPQNGGGGGTKPLETDEIRFNKFYFPSYALGPKGFKPLKKADYPLTGYVNNTLRISSAESVITPDDWEVVYNVPDMIDKIGGLPPHPEANEYAKFWDLLREVIYVQEVRRNNPKANLMMLPDNWKGHDLNKIAENVHNEYPGTHQSLLIADILSGKWGPIKIDTSIIPQRTGVPFLRKEFMLATMNTWVLSVVGPHNFAAKWYAGRARPEEVVWAIKKGRIYEGVPADIKLKINHLRMSSAKNFTAYKEGSPRHPSWPAMHAASTSLSFWLSIVLDLNEAQMCQARLTDYAISYARTVAGVHYPDDNIAGMNMAQHVLARALPKYLEEKYQSDPEAVARKIYKNRYDWRTFDTKNPCPKQNNY